MLFVQTRYMIKPYKPPIKGGYMNHCFSTSGLPYSFILSALLYVTVFGDNALRNGDFEHGGENWITWGGQISGELQYRGSYGAGVYSHESSWKGLHQKLPIPENARTFIVEGMMKTDEVAGGREFWERAVISVEFIDEVDSLVDGYPPKVAMVEGTTDWKKYSRKYSINFLASYIKVTLALGNATGSVQFDDISLIFFDEDGRELNCNDLHLKEHPLLSRHREASNRLANPSFSNGITDWQGTASMVSDNNGIQNSPCLQLNASSKDKWAFQLLALPENVHRIVVSGFIATEHVQAGKKFWQCANIGGEFLDENGIRIGNYLEPAGNVSGTTTFKEYTIVYEPRAGAVSLKIICGINGVSGTAFFDDLRVSYFDAEENEVH